MRRLICLLVVVLGLVFTSFVQQATSQEPDRTWTTTDGKTLKAGERMVKTVDGVEYAFRWCPAGKFMMGSPSSEQSSRDDDETQHEVTLTQGFWMLETEVTQGMWQSVMGESISDKAKQGTFSHNLHGEGSTYPMYYVSWNECQEFCRKLSEKIGMKIALPTEAQWEYACRAGTTGAFAGDLDAEALKSNNSKTKGTPGAFAGDLDAMGWYMDNLGGKTHPVGQKKPNAWGLYDMHGNVWECCSDWYGKKYYAESPSKDPTGPKSGSLRVTRGGGWPNSAHLCRSANRARTEPDFRDPCTGFRIVGLDE